jgi:disulfide bond formation protein DsbB
MISKSIAMDIGGVALALLLGALGFQYFAHFPPCEMCHWQRWPLIAASLIGIGGSLVVKGDPKWLAVATILLVATSGIIGAYQAGVEWHWWAGPSACTGARVVFHGFDKLNDPGAVRCDVAAWRLFGISLAGYNALISTGSALLGAVMLMRKR